MKKSRVFLLVCLASALALPGLSKAETRTIAWGPVTTYNDGTPIESNRTITYNFYWTSDAGVGAGSLRPVLSSVGQTTGTFDPDLVGMPRGTTVYITAEVVLSTGEKSSLAPAFPWAVPPPVQGSLPGLSELIIGCPSSLNEGESGVCTATALWSDGSMTPVSPSWSEGSPYASIGADGVLTTTEVWGDQPVTVTADYTSAGVTRTASATMMIVDLSVVTITAPLSELFIGCPPSLNEGEGGVCTATAKWSDGSMTPVSPAWSEGSPYASIGADGLLTTTAVSGDQPVTVTADYTSAGVTRTASTTVIIADLSVVTIMEPKNVNVSGPLTESPSLPIRLAWDPVASYTDGTPVPAGAVVDYSAYWTTDSTLSESSLKPLASSALSTSVYFDPTAQGMNRNQRVYFTTRAEDSTGKKSHLSASVPWKVNNTGPSSPRNGRIKRK